MTKTKKEPPSGSPQEVFFAFLKLGITSFGGPIAHLGYFRSEFVGRRRWVSEDQFAQLLAICQFLPGPASSQMGFSLGLLRAGWTGAIAAFVAFTLPSALLLVAFAGVLPLFSAPLGQAAIHGLKLVACAVVADAVCGMGKKLCPDAPRKTIAVLATAGLLLAPYPSAQFAVVLLSGIAGVCFLRDPTSAPDPHRLPLPYGSKTGCVLLVLFTALLVVLPLSATGNPDFVSVAAAFYRSGALVFGGGHVVLPLLQDSIVSSGWVTAGQFLSGYGASQAVPGPMFSFSAYLGTVLAEGKNPSLMAATALLSLFLPGFLLVAGFLPLWARLSKNFFASSAIAGINAGVVGVLAAALYDPIFLSGISGIADFLIAAAAFAALVAWRISPLYVVLWCVLASISRLWV